MKIKRKSQCNSLIIILALLFATNLMTNCELVETNEQEITEIIVENQTENDFEVQIDDQAKFLLEALQTYHYTIAKPGAHSISVTSLPDLWTGSIKYFDVDDKETKIILLYTNLQGELVLTTNR